MRFDTSLDRPLIAPTPRDLFAVVFRQKRIVLVSFIVVLLGMTLSWLLTPRYRAHMKILVRRERLDPVVSSEASVTQNKPEEMSEEKLNSEVELLNSEELLRKVVLATGLQNTKNIGGGSGGTPNQVDIARATERLRSRLSVEPLPRLPAPSPFRSRFLSHASHSPYNLASRCVVQQRPECAPIPWRERTNFAGARKTPGVSSTKSIDAGGRLV